MTQNVASDLGKFEQNLKIPLKNHLKRNWTVLISKNGTFHLALKWVKRPLISL